MSNGGIAISVAQQAAAALITAQAGPQGIQGPQGPVAALSSLNLAYSIKDYSAKGDGTTDDTAAIQSAITAVHAAGGGKVFVPAGTYIVNPATARLIYYSNMVFEGVGRASIIKVKNNAGNYGTMFGATTDGTAVTNVTFRHLAFDQNSAGNTTCDVQTTINNVQNVLRFFNNVGVMVEHCHFEYCGVNAITMNGSGNAQADVSHNSFNFTRAASTVLHGDYDNSAVYFDCLDHTAIGNRFTATIAAKARGGIESHRGPSVIADNLFDNFQTGVNIVNSAASAVGDQNSITVVDNTLHHCNYGIMLWSVTGRVLRNVVVANNTITVSQVDYNQLQCLGISLINISDGTLDGTYENISITDNVIQFQSEGTGRATDQYGVALVPYIYGIGLAPRGSITNATVTGNIIVNAPAKGIDVGPVKAGSIGSDIRIADNLIIDAGQNLLQPVQAHRAALFVESTLVDVVLENNIVRDTGVSALNGFQSVWANPTSGTRVRLRGTIISSVFGALTYSIARAQVTDGGGTTAQRPTNPQLWEQFYDTTLIKPIWWNGSVWKDVAGTTV